MPKKNLFQSKKAEIKELKEEVYEDSGQKWTVFSREEAAVKEKDYHDWSVFSHEEDAENPAPLWDAQASPPDPSKSKEEQAQIAYWNAYEEQANKTYQVLNGTALRNAYTFSPKETYPNDFLETVTYGVLYRYLEGNPISECFLGKDVTMEEFLKTVTCKPTDYYHSDNGIDYPRNLEGRYSDYQINSFVKSMELLLGGNGDLINRIDDLDGKESQTLRELRSDLLGLRRVFRFDLDRINQSSSETGIQIPTLNKDLSDSISRFCTSYIEDHGYQNTPENKLIRDIRNATDCAMLNSSSFEQGRDRRPLINDKLKYLGTELDAVKSVSLLNSKEFNHLRDSLEAITKDPKNIDDEKIKNLRDAAKLYMNEKIASGHKGSRRSTPKGQTRFDIASDLYNLCETYTQKAPTPEELKTLKDKLAGKTEKKSKFERTNVQEKLALNTNETKKLKSLDDTGISHRKESSQIAAKRSKSYSDVPKSNKGKGFEL